MQEVEFSFGIVVISAIAERIEYPYASFAIASVGIEHCMIAPTVVDIFYHYIAITVKYSRNIPLRVAAVEIYASSIFYADYSRIIVDKFKSVALLYDSAVLIEV